MSHTSEGKVDITRLIHLNNMYLLPSLSPWGVTHDVLFHETMSLVTSDSLEVRWEMRVLTLMVTRQGWEGRQGRQSITLIIGGWAVSGVLPPSSLSPANKARETRRQMKSSNFGASLKLSLVIPLSWSFHAPPLTLPSRLQIILVSRWQQPIRSMETTK